VGVSMTMDCADLDGQAAFWVEALGFHEVGRVPDMVRLEGPEGAIGLRLLFLQQVPEPKTAKNRMHLDWDVEDMAAEADRLVALGATRGEAHRRGRVAWICMQDPEGNEFCLEQVMTESVVRTEIE
jgi:catechol 2,3-dioxygenase-like lactoylglutathione lyase family enzyme